MKRAGFIFVLLVAVLASCTTENSNVIDLSGTWNFKMDSLDEGIEGAWYASALEEAICLPGSMPEQKKGKLTGYDTKFTGNMWKRFEDEIEWYEDKNYAPYINEGEYLYPFWLVSEYYYAGAAWYQKVVTIPEDWEGKDVELFLERCHWETRVWVNDQYVGMQNALGVPHRYALGSFLEAGENKISICVDNRVKDIKVGDDAHSVSDNTQSNWNGIVGELKLVKRDEVSIAGVQIYPDVEKGIARVEVRVRNLSSLEQLGEIKVCAKGLGAAASDKVECMVSDFSVGTDGGEIELSYEMGEDVMLWDEFSANLYELKVMISGESFNDETVETFGMRDFYAEGKGFEINGRPVFLRGTLECAIFPKTGYPPCDVESWEKIIEVCKAHGLNHIRFHSWCPPEAAFEAADKLGFYFQVEASAWTHVGSGEPIDEWLYDESRRMVAEYGNHPSFCLMPYGNEPHGPHHREYLVEFVKYWKAKDSRRVYTTAAGWPIVPENDFHNVHNGTRIQGWNQGLKSVINSEAPRSDYDWEETVARLTAPMISHEVGQWCVYPNLKEQEKYDGVLKAKNFKIFERSLAAHGMGHLADSFLMASGKLQALCYKADIEAALRTKGFGGFQLLDLHDFPGQGTALVGVLDPFWEEKGYISPEEFRSFSNETVPLARFGKMIFTDDEQVEVLIEVAHYGEHELEAVVPKWRICDKGGEVVKEGAFEQRDISWGNCIKLGEISASVPASMRSKYSLFVEVAGFENSWDFWVYPGELPEIEDDIYVCSRLDAKAEQVLKDGCKVLVSIEKGSIAEGKGGEVGIGFSSIFWNTAWTNLQKPHTLGVLCDPDHAAFGAFPTESYSNWQWWDAMSHSNAIYLEDFEEVPDPIVRVIDDWVSNRNLGLVFEVQVGEGSLIFSGIDLQNGLEERPEGRQLLYSLKKYMMSEDFAPETQVSISELKSLFK